MPKKKQTLKKKSEFGRIFDFFYTVLGLIFVRWLYKEGDSFIEKKEWKRMINKVTK